MSKAKDYKLRQGKLRLIKHVNRFCNIPLIGLTYKKAAKEYCSFYKKPIPRDFDEWLLKELDADAPLKNSVIVKRKKKATYKKDYLKFLKGTYWKAVKEMILRRDNSTCQHCGSKTELHVHHKTYVHHKDELNHLEDLITLCKTCHKNEHDRLLNLGKGVAIE